MTPRSRIEDNGNNSNCSRLLEALYKSYAKGRILDQTTCIREVLSKEPSFKKLPRATFYRCLRKLFDLGYISKAVIEDVLDMSDSNGDSAKIQKVICIPRNKELERILSKQAGKFEFEDAIKIEENKEGSRTLKIKAKALKNVKGPVPRLMILDLTLNAAYSNYIKAFPRVERDHIMYFGEEVTLQLMRLEKPCELMQRIKALEEQLKETEAQLKQEEWELYNQLKKVIYSTKKESLQQRKIDDVGIYVSKDLGGLFHLERKLEKAKKELKNGEVYCVLEEHGLDQAKTSTITLSKSKRSLMIIPQLLHKDGVDFKPLILVYNGWSENPQIYAIRAYMSISLVWIDALLSKKEKAEFARYLRTRLFRVPLRIFPNNYPSVRQY